MEKARTITVRRSEQGWFLESNYDPGFSCTGVYHMTRQSAEHELKCLKENNPARRIDLEMETFA